MEKHFKNRKPKLLNTRWTAEEDRNLALGVRDCGSVANWDRISERVGLKPPAECRERWVKCIDPSISRNSFTATEDESILRFHGAFTGGQWETIAGQFWNRTAGQLQSRYHELQGLERPVLPETQVFPRWDPVAKERDSYQNDSSLNFHQLRHGASESFSSSTPTAAVSTSAGTCTPKSMRKKRRLDVGTPTSSSDFVSLFSSSSHSAAASTSSGTYTWTPQCMLKNKSLKPGTPPVGPSSRESSSSSTSVLHRQGSKSVVAKKKLF